MWGNEKKKILLLILLILFSLKVLGVEKEPMSICLGYSWLDGNTDRMVVCENAGYPPEYWLESCIESGEFKEVYISLVDEVEPVSLFLEMRSRQENIDVEGKLIINKVAFYSGETIVFTYEKEELEKILNRKYDFQESGCIYEVGNDVDRIYFEEDGLNEIKERYNVVITKIRLLKMAGLLMGSLIMLGFAYLESKQKCISRVIKKIEDGKIQYVLLFSVALVLMLYYCYKSRESGFRGDAYEMWEVAKTYFDGDGRYHSFVEYRSPLAFIFFAIIYKLSVVFNINDVLFYRVVASIMFAILFSILIPKLYVNKLQARENEPGIIRRMIFICIGYYFFKGYFIMPFTDCWGMFFLTLAVLRAKKFFESGCKENTRTVAGTGILFLIEISMAIAFRSSFKISYIVLVLVTIVTFRYYRKEKNILKNIAWFCVLITVGSMAVELLIDVPNAGNPMRQQLTGAYIYQKVEFGEQGSLYFNNPIGNMLINNGIDEEWWINKCYLVDYIRLAFLNWKYTLIMGIKGLFNGLDICHNTIITPNVTKVDILFSLINYTLIFISGIKGKVILSEKNFSDKLVLLVWVTNVIPYCLGIVEVRFFMPLLVNMYAMTCLKKGENFNRKKSICILALYIGFIVLCLNMHFETYANLL